jgi:hypothetical protein
LLTKYTMTAFISRSLPQNILSPDGNSLAVYIDEPSGVMYVKDIYGNIEPLENYLSQDSIDNIGGGSELYVNGTSKPFQLRTLTQGTNVVLTQNANDIEISVPSVVGTTLYYGSFFSTQTQTTIGNEQKAMTFNNTDATATLGFSIVSNSRITATNTGVYNLAFSAQVKKTQGGGATSIYIWLDKNGSPVADTTTVLKLANNGDFAVAAWNFFIQLNAGQYVELYWYATSSAIELHYDPSPVVGIPEIPSVIATINRIG